MESGNSGSMSSSGEEDYDSRSESLPTFLNTSMSFGAIAAANSHQPPSSFLSNDQIGSSFLFGASNAFLHMTPHPPPSNSAADNPFLLGFDLLHPSGGSGGGSGRSSFNFDDIHGGVASSCGQSNNNNVLGPGRGGGGGVSSGQNVNPSPVPSHRDQNTNIPVRNPKKRTRASRRAPTTVLTTDTTNFRAMVQEFTGIPAPPFSGSSYSRRLDLFGGSGSGLRSGLDSLYPIRRPSPQKIQNQPPSSSSEQLNSIPQNVSVLNMPNTVLTFQSLLQSQQGNMIMPPGHETHHRHAATNPHISDDRHEHGTSNDKYGISNSSNTSQRVVGNKVNCKLNYNSNASSGLENVGSRGEGTVDTSWICPSD